MEKKCISEFIKETKTIKIARVRRRSVVFQIARETILLLINNIHESRLEIKKLRRLKNKKIKKIKKI